MQSEVNFEYRHPVDGYLRISGSSQTVKLECRWPFDLNTSDWITIRNEFYFRDFLQAVEDAAKLGSGKSMGVTGGFIEITSLNDGFYLNFSNAVEGWQQKSLRLKVPRPLESLKS